MWYVPDFSPSVPARVDARMRPNPDQDRAAVEQVFDKYLQSLDAADVALASKVYLARGVLAPDVIVEDLTDAHHVRNRPFAPTHAHARERIDNLS